jgi:hypothetical protein
VDFFVYSRDAPGTTLRDDSELLEAHWSYMDTFAESMIAREPNNCAGVYADHVIWRFENLLGRTMWAFSGAADEPRFLIIARLDRNQTRSIHPIPHGYLQPDLRARLIIYGVLSTLEDAVPVGVALAVHAPDRDAAAALLEDGRTGFAVFQDVEIHNWELGGRR